MVAGLARQIAHSLAVLQDLHAIAIEAADDRARRRRSEAPRGDTGLIFKRGAQRHLELLAEILAGSERGAALLSSQEYRLEAIQSIGDDVIARLTWIGTVGIDAGPLVAGQQLIAHIAQFATVRDGRIARIETFDCYEPIGAPA